MDGIVVAYFVPAVVFLAVVAPIWIFMHYRSKQQAQGALSEDERLELEALAAQAGSMSERIETLEAILDTETPEWRDRMGEGQAMSRTGARNSDGEVPRRMTCRRRWNTVGEGGAPTSPTRPPGEFVGRAASFIEETTTLA